MLASEIITLARDITNTNSTTLTDADALRWLNRAYMQRQLDILRVATDKNASIKEVKTTFISTVGLVAGNTGFNGEYPFPTDLLRPVRFEVSYDGASWKKCEIYDNPSNTSSEFNDSQINAEFSQDNPRVDFTRDSYKIRPLNSSGTNITDGIYIEYEKRQPELIATDTPLFEEGLHDILAYDIASMEAKKHPKRYDNVWYQRFTIDKNEVVGRFVSHFKNRFKRTMSITNKYINYR